MKTLLRSVVPGHAQLVNGQKKKAYVFNGALVALLVLSGATPWLHTPPGLLSFLAALAAWLIAAWLDGRRHRGAGTPARVGATGAVFLATPWLLVAALVVPAFRTDVLGLQAYRIPAGHDSSAPTLVGRDRFLVAVERIDPERGMLVVFEPPDDPGKTYVKRIVALSGDVVEGGPDGIRVNGRVVAPRAVDPFGPVMVPAGRVFALGDNPQNSRDSRHFGAVPVGAITGRPLYVFWSERWDRIGTTLH